MQWLISLETDQELISICRLLNVFRRKGLKVVTLAMASRTAGFSVLTLVDSPESEVDHIFNFLRRTEGVQHVTYYRHELLAQASFVFVDEDADSSKATRIFETLPGAKLIFASHGKYLLEISAESRTRWPVSGLDEAAFLTFAQVKTSRNAPRPEMVGSLSER